MVSFDAAPKTRVKSIVSSRAQSVSPYELVLTVWRAYGASMFNTSFRKTIATRSTIRVAAAILCTTAFVAACGGNAPEPAAPATPTPTSVGSTAVVTRPEVAAATAAPAPVVVPAAFRDAKVKDQQMAFMQTKVMPPMTKVFSAHDAKRYADFSCKTCHGPNYVEPKVFLPKLTMKGGKITSFAEKPEVSKWMAEKVVPEMAAAMGEKPYDPATHQGFGCGGCHTIEMK
jgi:hypothetical protein